MMPVVPMTADAQADEWQSNATIHVRATVVGVGTVVIPRSIVVDMRAVVPPMISPMAVTHLFSLTDCFRRSGRRRNRRSRHADCTQASKRSTKYSNRQQAVHVVAFRDCLPIPQTALDLRQSSGEAN